MIYDAEQFDPLWKVGRHFCEHPTGEHKAGRIAKLQIRLDQYIDSLITGQISHEYDGSARVWDRFTENEAVRYEVRDDLVATSIR